jgi:hypothetical protein
MHLYPMVGAWFLHGRGCLDSRQTITLPEQYRQSGRSDADEGKDDRSKGHLKWQVYAVQISDKTQFVRRNET